MHSIKILCVKSLQFLPKPWGWSATTDLHFSVSRWLFPHLFLPFASVQLSVPTRAPVPIPGRKHTHTHTHNKMLKGKKRKKQSSKYNLSVITEVCSCFNTNFHKVQSSCGTGQPYLPQIIRLPIWSLPYSIIRSRSWRQFLKLSCCWQTVLVLTW